MPEITWIKISTGIFDDEKIKIIESLPDADSLLIHWLKLLVLAGKINAGGYIFIAEDMPYTAETLSLVFNRSLNTTRLALETFEKFGLIEINSRGILIRNWEKHQNIEGMERIREQTRKRVKDYREKQKLLEPPVALRNVTVTQQNRIDKNREDIYTPIFELWNSLNIKKHRTLKEDTCRTLATALKDYSKEDICTAIGNYAEIVNGPEYYFNYKWALKDFLKRGIEKFMDGEVARQNYLKGNTGQEGGLDNRSRMAWNTPSADEVAYSNRPCQYPDCRNMTTNEDGLCPEHRIE